MRRTVSEFRLEEVTLTHGSSVKCANITYGQLEKDQFMQIQGQSIVVAPECEVCTETRTFVDFDGIIKLDGIRACMECYGQKASITSFFCAARVII